MSNHARLFVALPNDGLFFFFEQRHSLAFSNQLHEDSFVLSHEFSSSLCISVKSATKYVFIYENETKYTFRIKDSSLR